MRKLEWSALFVPAAAIALVGALACGGSEKAADSAAPAAEPAAQTAAAGPADGAQVYTRCVTCHQANGEGTPGVYPPLAGSEYVNAANGAVPIRIVINGLQGPITVKGQQFNSLMPAYGTGIEMSNEEVAAVVSYIRTNFGNSAGPVTVDDVAKEKAAPAGGPVTAESLAPLMK